MVSRRTDHISGFVEMIFLFFFLFFLVILLITSRSLLGGFFPPLTLTAHTFLFGPLFVILTRSGNCRITSSKLLHPSIVHRKIFPVFRLNRLFKFSSVTPSLLVFWLGNVVSSQCRTFLSDADLSRNCGWMMRDFVCARSGALCACRIQNQSKQQNCEHS